MKKSKFETIVQEIVALAPMCNFGTPRALCTAKQEFFRARYDELNIHKLINMEES
jgi:hypothetical protein